ncbi:hypothetical protein LIER_35181 [Lithospermum erythrorhizon]|uniref:WW domain-containing protein n=1 Tax=Lithospermum erythrorhizon TaxID=34254 RepID=A0AAV3NLK3_LITER
MKTPNMSSITSSLEISLQDFSLNHKNSSGGGGSSMGTGGGRGGGDGLEENKHDISNNTSETTYDLNSHISLPSHWEQCLDLKTGELFYINWRTGMKANEDPRTEAAIWNDDFDEYSEDDDSSSYDSEDSSAEQSPPSFSRNQCLNKINCNNYNSNDNQSNEGGNVLVVGGCKSCMMYFMVPKQVEDCPKCSGQLLHFDKPENACS